jgi:hypothetical protein
VGGLELSVEEHVTEVKTYHYPFVTSYHELKANGSIRMCKVQVTMAANKLVSSPRNLAERSNIPNANGPISICHATLRRTSRR